MNVWPSISIGIGGEDYSESRGHYKLVNMQLSDVQRRIVKAVVRQFLDQKGATSRKTLVREFRSSQAFHELTSARILGTAQSNVPTMEETYLPLALAFHYCDDVQIIQRVRTSLSFVLRVVQRLFDNEIDRTGFTLADVETCAEELFDLPPGTENLRLGLYIARDVGVFYTYSMSADQTEVLSFGIAESIVDINDYDDAWDQFVARCTPRESLTPQWMPGSDVSGILHSDASNRLIDAVTGLLQRAELDTDLKRAAETDNILPLSFLMIDLDHFKSFNDTYGHPVGDEVLNAVANIISVAARGKGSVYRYGGEEIAVILPNYTINEAVAIAERIRLGVAALRLNSIEDSCVTASLGAATVPDTSEGIDDLLRDGDRALYAAKHGGRNRVCRATSKSEEKRGGVGAASFDAAEV